MPKKTLSSSKQTDAHRCEAALDNQNARSFLVGCRRNCGKNNSLGQSHVEILYVVLAAVPWNFLHCLAGKVFFRLLLLVVFQNQELTQLCCGALLCVFCVLGSNADVSPLACGVGIQRLYTPTAGEAGLAPQACLVPTAGRHFAICVS